MKIKPEIIVMAFFTIFLINGCAAHFPKEKEWKQTPIFQEENKEFISQGDFNNVDEFLLAIEKLKEGMSYEEVQKLGFRTELKNGCDMCSGCEKIGWRDASNIAMENTHLMVDFETLDEIIEGKKQYDGIRCVYKNIKSRADKKLTYFNNRDFYNVGRDINLILIFKNKMLVGFSPNDKPIKEHNRESSFGKGITDIFSLPEIRPTVPIK